MIRENQRLLNQLHVITDGVVVFAAMLLSYWLRFGVFHGGENLPVSYYLWLGAGAAVLTMAVFAVAGLYTSFRTIRFHVEVTRAAALELLVALILMSAMYVLRLGETSRWTVAIFYVIGSVLLHMIKTPGPIDASAHIFAQRRQDGHFVPHHVVLHFHIRHRAFLARPGNRACIKGLSARGGVEGGAIQRRPAFRPQGDHLGLEFRQVCVVIIQPLGFHGAFLPKGRREVIRFRARRRPGSAFSPSDSRCSEWRRPRT